MGSVTWHNHKNFLLDKVQCLLKANSLLDCTLAAEGQYLRAHKLILASSSPYFELLFNQENEKNPIVILKDVKFEELKSIINFIYYGEVHVLVNEMESFFKTAETLQIIGLIDLNKQRVGKENFNKKNSLNEPSVMCNSHITTNKSIETNSRENPLNNNIHFDCSNKPTSASASIPSALSSNSSVLSYDDTRLNDSWKLQKKYTHKENSFPPSLERFISTVDNIDKENSLEYNQDFVMETCVDTKGDNAQNALLNNKRDTVCNSRVFGIKANKHSDNFQNSNSKVESNRVLHECASESVVDDHIPFGFSDLRTNICIKPESGVVENSTERQIESKPANEYFDSDDARVSFSQPQTNCEEGNDNTKVNYLPRSHLVVIKQEPSEFSPRDHVECEMQSDYIESDTVPVDSVYLNEDRIRNDAAATSVDSAVNSLMEDYSVLEKLQSMPDTIVQRTSSDIPQSCIETSESRANGKKVLFCPYCNKEFPWVSSLELHIRSHTGEKPYWCQYCDAKFARKDYLQTHMVRHSGQKRFECSECGKRFTQKHNLKYHEDAHKGLKRFQCLKCNKRFTQRGSLNAHLASCLGENPFLSTIS